MLGRSVDHDLRPSDVLGNRRLIPDLRQDSFWLHDDGLTNRVCCSTCVSSHSTWPRQTEVSRMNRLAFHYTHDIVAVLLEEFGELSPVDEFEWFSCGKGAGVG